MIIDSHAHVVLPVADHLSAMDEAEVDKTILFCTTVHPEKAVDLKGFLAEMEILHEIIGGKRNGGDARIQATVEQARVIRENPDRFIGFGTVPLGLDDRQTGEWVEKYIAGNHFAGLGEFTPAPGTVSQLETVFRAACEFSCLPIWIHGFWPLQAPDIKEMFQLAVRYPDIPVIIGHLGGTSWMEVIAAAKENRNIYIDLSAAYAAVAQKIAMQEAPDRCLFSSDLPYGDLILARQAVERLCADEAVRGRVLGGNVAELLRI